MDRNVKTSWRKKGNYDKVLLLGMDFTNYHIKLNPLRAGDYDVEEKHVKDLSHARNEMDCGAVDMISAWSPETLCAKRVPGSATWMKGGWEHN